MDGSLGGMALRLITSLGLVLVLMGGLGWMARRKGLALGPSRLQGLKVLGTYQLGPRASLSVVRVGGTALVLSVADGRVEVVREMTLDELGIEELDGRAEQATAHRPSRMTASPTPWKELLEGLRERTIRRA